MRTETAKRILEETPQEIKDKVIETTKNKLKMEQYSEEYIKRLYGRNRHHPMYAPDVTQSKTDFKAGYNQKTVEIEDLIEKLELTKLDRDYYPLKEEMVNNYNAEQDRKINLLKILL